MLTDKNENPRILPAVLYKYMSANRITFFDDWLIRFTQPIALNDPFEMRPHIAGYGTPEEVHEIATRRWEEHVRKQYAAIVRKSIGQGEPMKFDTFRADMEHTRASQIENALLQAPGHNAVMAEKINELVNKSIGVLSLCEHYDSLLMWPHYGDNHRGFVIELDASSSFFHRTAPPEHVNADKEESASFTAEYGRLRPIQYLTDRPSAVVTGLSFDTLLVKGEDWEYEGEWRMLMPLEYADLNNLSLQQGLPVCLFAVPPSSVKAILLGCNSSKELLDQVLKLRANPETQHIRIAKAHVDQKHFRLNFVEVH
ncbi:DUF2971 domain-containing protein [Limnohabitans sp.]|uniref:DUF2971 domain-containing protein n=1 Tax=Limnohabitans sp. TaxID=1907725 RepID=UPI0031FC2712